MDNPSGNLKFKLYAIAAIALSALAIPFACDPVNPKTREPLKRYTWQERLRQVPGINLGLDLRGGDHIVLTLDPAPAVLAEVNNAKDLVHDDVIALAPSASLRNDGNDPRTFLVDGVPAGKLAEMQHKVEQKLPAFAVEEASGGALKATMTPARYDIVREQAVEQSRAVIESRINSLGVSEPVIQRQGDNRVVVEVAGNESSSQLKELISNSGRLEWHLVAADDQKSYGSKDEALAAHGGIPPAGTSLYEGDSTVDGEAGRWIFLQTDTPLTGADLVGAQSTTDEGGKPSVGFHFAVKAGEKFRALTGANKGKLISITLNDKAISTATIQDAIGAEGIIHGSFSQDQVEAIVGLLKGGSMPTKPHIEAATHIGPSLGAESVRNGILASLLGIGLVAGFLLFYYRKSGLNASLALLLNLVITLAAMTLIHAVLTLPGIAGMILTIGMAVDANVLIFERIREELRGGKTVASAIESGFSKAWSAIFDSNLSTLIAALCLILLGQGPVKGFAVTLTIGLIASLFTAVGVSRVIFQWEYSRPSQDKDAISIGNVNAFANLKFDLMKWKGAWIALSLALLLIGVFAVRRGVPLGLDLAGGYEIEAKFAQAAAAEPRAVEQKLHEAVEGEVTATGFGKEADQTLLIRAPQSATVKRAALAEMTDEEFAKTDKTRLMDLAVRHALIGQAAAGKLDLNAATEEQLREAFRSGLAAGSVKSPDPKLSSDDAAKRLAAAFRAARDAAGIVRADAAVSGLDAASLKWFVENNTVSPAVIRRVEYVGPAVGDELRKIAFAAILASTLLHLIYLWIRFELRFSVGAIIAMVHDVLITLGIFCLLAPALKLEMTLPVLAAFLTLSGYSINDTIVVFDRIRETLKKTGGAGGENELFNRALNEMLPRTILVSLTAFLAVLALFILGGPALRGFSFVMLVGIVVGTYSSIYIASPWAILWKRLQDKWFPTKGAVAATARR